MLKPYFKNLYQAAMQEAYDTAVNEITSALSTGGDVLDCGAYDGYLYNVLVSRSGSISQSRYYGIEWDAEIALKAQQKGLNILCSDLNNELPFEDSRFQCVYGLSVLEHLLNGCKFIKECHRVLRKNGTLILLTPNISTYFTALLILMGRMPSTGPHPDSDTLIKSSEIFKVSDVSIQPDTERETPIHRHLVVFSYRDLFKYLKMLGFAKVTGHGFGLYPFPQFMQPFLRRLDPYHCHQMIFIARK